MKALARHLLLAALILRALLPTGWMPGTAAGTPALVLCTMDGAHAPQQTPGKQAPDDAQHHDQCPFAAAPHFAKTPDVAAFAAPSLQANRIRLAALPHATASPTRYQPQSPRAPPLFA